MFSGDLAPSSAAEWTSVLSSFAALVVTATIALAGFLKDIRQRSEAARNAVLLARGIAERAVHQVDRVPDFYQPADGATAVRYGAKSFLVSPSWLELMEAITEMRPQDLPDNSSAESYVHVRAILRSINVTLRAIADLGPESDGFLFWPSLDAHRPILQRERDHLNARAENLKHPLTPRWLKVWRLRRAIRTLNGKALTN